MEKKNTGFIRIWFATIYSMKGLKAAFQSEAAIRQELAAMMLLIPLCFFMNVSTIERVIMIMSLCIVLIAELLNTAVEALSDRVSTEVHILIAKAKDIGSAAVFVALVQAVTVWLLIVFG
ncbi:diacylglycerol kinase [Alteromonas antoniana]|uniref:diacylglycerol kinase n=1 Tax=Alteromonas antoniana TaxID=2803813 RepID=UPI0030842C3B